MLFLGIFVSANIEHKPEQIHYFHNILMLLHCDNQYLLFSSVLLLLFLCKILPKRVLLERRFIVIFMTPY